MRVADHTNAVGGPGVDLAVAPVDGGGEFTGIDIEARISEGGDHTGKFLARREAAHRATVRILESLLQRCRLIDRQQEAVDRQVDAVGRAKPAVTEQVRSIAEDVLHIEKAAAELRLVGVQRREIIGDAGGFIIVARIGPVRVRLLRDAGPKTGGHASNVNGAAVVHRDLRHHVMSAAAEIGREFQALEAGVEL